MYINQTREPQGFSNEITRVFCQAALTWCYVTYNTHMCAHTDKNYQIQNITNCSTWPRGPRQICSLVKTTLFPSLLHSNRRTHGTVCSDENMLQLTILILQVQISTNLEQENMHLYSHLLTSQYHKLAFLLQSVKHVTPPTSSYLRRCTSADVFLYIIAPTW